jgi:hypothetical protein
LKSIAQLKLQRRLGENLQLHYEQPNRKNPSLVKNLESYLSRLKNWRSNFANSEFTSRLTFTIGALLFLHEISPSNATTRDEMKIPKCVEMYQDIIADESQNAVLQLDFWYAMIWLTPATYIICCGWRCNMS